MIVVCAGRRNAGIVQGLEGPVPGRHDPRFLVFGLRHPLNHESDPVGRALLQPETDIFASDGNKPFIRVGDPGDRPAGSGIEQVERPAAQFNRDFVKPAEVRIERGLADPDCRGNLPGRDPLYPVAAEQLHCHFKDMFAPGAAAGWTCLHHGRSLHSP